MNKFFNRYSALFAIFAFLITRAIIMLHDPIITDMHLYFDISTRAAWGQLEVYKDFPFAYPFLAWFAICWPPLLNSQITFDAYQAGIHLLFFTLELAAVGFCFWKFKEDKKTFSVFTKALFFYSLLSVFQLDLIYDRMDLMMTLTLVLVFCCWNTWLGASFLVGFELKLLPIMIWPLKFLELWKSDRKRAFISTWIPAAAIAILILSDYLSFPGELAALSNHSSRGIQVESLWASPFQALHILGLDPSGHIQTVFGAQEIFSDYLTPTIHLIAKYFGFVAIGVVYLFARIDMKTWTGRTRGFLLVFLAFLCFQRVLSTQFMLWLAPFLGLSLALEFSWLYFLLSLMIFALTCFTFDPGYWDMIKYDPFFTTLLFTRNFLLLMLFVFSILRGKIGQSKVQNQIHE